MSDLPLRFKVVTHADELVTEHFAQSLVGMKYPLRIGEQVIDEAEVVAARSLLPGPGVELTFESLAARLKKALGGDVLSVSFP